MRGRIESVRTLRGILLALQPPEAGLEAAASIVKILAEAPPEDLPKIEESIRPRWRYERRVSVADDLLDTADVHALGLLSFHANGFIREAAVRRLAAIRDGTELRYLLLRLSDWVPQVREAARRPVLARLREDHAFAVARNFALVERLAAVQRADYPALVAPLARLFASDAGTIAILEVLASGSRKAQRGLVRFVASHAPTVLASIARQVERIADAVVRTRVVPSVARVLPDGEALPILQRLTADASPAVRRESLLTVAQSFRAEAQPHLVQAVTDRSASVRETARFLLRDAAIDFPAMYRTAMSASTSRILTPAIAGLSETGTPSDAERVAEFLSHPIPKVRRAALQGVMRLSPARFAAAPLTALADPSPAVSAAARNALRKRAAGLTRTELLGIFSAATTHHTRANVLVVLAALPKWQSLIALLQAATFDDVASLAHRHLETWNRQYTRSHATPSPQEIREVREALACVEAKLDRTMVAEIRLGVQAFG